MTVFYTDAKLIGGRIFLRGYEDGKRFSRTVNCRPSLFIASPEPTGLTTVHGRDVKRVTFDSPAEAREFIERYRKTDGFDVFGMPNFLYPFLNERFPGEIEYDPKLIRIVPIDIETDSSDGFPNVALANREITVVTVRFRDRTMVFDWGDRVYVPHRDGIELFHSDTEADMLRRLVTALCDLDPDVITGWNVEYFDIAYLVNRIVRVLGDEWVKRLSPWGRVRERTGYDDYGNELTTYEIDGLSVIDGMAAYKKFTFKNHESYALDFVARDELGRGKVDYRDEYGSLHGLFERNYQKYVEYNVEDNDLVFDLEQKLGFISQIVAIAYMAKILYQDASTTVRLWDVLIHNFLLSRGMVVPTDNPHAVTGNAVGGYVKPTRVGKFGCVVSFDLKSSYPHNIMQYNISPETFVRMDPPMYDIDEDGRVQFHQTLMDGGYDTSDIRAADEVRCPNGAVFERSRRGFLPQLMDDLFARRATYEQLMVDDPSQKTRWHNMQLATKYILNGGYGALLNEFFRWYDVRYGEAVTTCGQLAVKWGMKTINDAMNGVLKTSGEDYIIAGDTDSMFVDFGPLVRAVGIDAGDHARIADFVCRAYDTRFKGMIESGFEELARYMNAPSNRLRMGREAIAESAIWTGKKRYVLNVIDNKGVRNVPPKLKIVGIEAVKSNVPKLMRSWIRDAIGTMISRSESEFVAEVSRRRNEFMGLPFIDIAAPQGITDIDKYASVRTIYGKGAQAHHKAALVYNHMVKTLGLSDRYASIRSGDRFRWVYLKKQNPIGQHTIGTPDSLPTEFGLDEYIDRDAQFERVFLGPVRNVAKAIGWNTESRADLTDMFG